MMPSKIKEIITQIFQGWFGMLMISLIGINNTNQSYDIKGFPQQVTAIA
ncbi:hypothetical protein [Bacteroides sp. HPS0048]|nr:hypothetical protein [Bacteroides sp. HPS0048]